MKNIFYILIFALSLQSCLYQDNTESEKLEKSKSDQIDDLANRYLDLNRFSGSILVASHNHVIYTKNFGLADYENEIPFSSKSAFKIGELTKLITSELLNQLVKEKKVSPNAKVSALLPELKSDLTVDDFLKLKLDIDYTIAGRLIEKLSHKSYQENIKEYSSKLDLENTYYNKVDSLKVIGYLFSNYRGNGLELHKAPAYKLEEAFSSTGLKSTCTDLMKILTAYSKPISMDGYLESDGFSYSVVNDLEDKTTIIVLSNRRHPIAKEISTGINSILNEKEYTLPLLREPFAIDTAILKDFAGIYALNENVEFEVLNANDSLYVLMGPNKVYLVPQSANQFYMIEMDASMRFACDSTGVVDKIVLLNGFIDSDQIAKRKK